MFFVVMVGFVFNMFGLLLIYGCFLLLKLCEGFGESIYSMDEGDLEMRFFWLFWSLDIESGDGFEECIVGEDIFGGLGFKIFRRVKKFLEEYWKVIGKFFFFLFIVLVWIFGVML